MTSNGAFYRNAPLGSPRRCSVTDGRAAQLRPPWREPRLCKLLLGVNRRASSREGTLWSRIEILPVFFGIGCGSHSRDVPGGMTLNGTGLLAPRRRVQG